MCSLFGLIVKPTEVYEYFVVFILDIFALLLMRCQRCGHISMYDLGNGPRFPLVSTRDSVFFDSALASASFGVPSATCCLPSNEGDAGLKFLYVWVSRPSDLVCVRVFLCAAHSATTDNDGAVSG